ncbi:MAG: hypothetical protein IKO06_01010 [Alphaproteobacteria bacterium]|nr:hypothetical protein [Alphaproteobacteria bacterium]
MKKYLAVLLVLLVCVACQSAPKKEEPKVETISLNYREHVVVKGGDEKHVIYEYSDVRIDDVASLAIKYCKNVNPKSQASLRDIYMYKNHKRRAYFDCRCVAEQ